MAPQASSPRFLRTLSVALVLAAAFLVFLPSVGHDFFIYDDIKYIVKTPQVAEGLTPAGVKWAFTTFETAEWHPLTWISLMATSSFSGTEPWGYHLVNVLLHTVNTLLLFLFLRAATGRFWASLAVAALFALHPLRVESVAWVAERKDVQSAFFWLLTLLCYARYCLRRSPGRYLLVVLFFAMGLMSKPILVTTPFLLLLLDFWPFGRISLEPAPEGARWPRVRLESWKVLWEKIPLLVLTGLSIWISVLAYGREGWAPLADYPLVFRAANAVVGYATYLRQMVWPAGLALFYPSPRAELPLARFLPAAVVLLAMTALAVAQARKRPWVFVGWFWFVGTLTPVIGLTQQATADRFTYIPMVGILVLAVWGAAEVMQRRGIRPAVAAGLLVLVLAILSAATVRQLSLWKDPAGILEHSAAVTEGNFSAHMGLVSAYRNRGEGREAFRHYLEAASISPSSVAVWHNQRATERIENGRFADAAGELALAVDVSPADADTLNRLGATLLVLGRLDEAETRFRQALAADPENAPAVANLKALPALREAFRKQIPGFRFTVDLGTSHPFTVEWGKTN